MAPNPLNLPKNNPIDEALENRKKREKCLAQGGKWENNACILPQSKAGAQAPLTKVPKVNGALPDRTITDVEGNQKIQTIEETRRLQDEAQFTKSLNGGLSAAQAVSEKERQAAIEAEAQAEIANEPVRRELDPVTNELEIIPVVGPLLNKIQRGIKDLVPFLGKDDDPRFTEVTPEELRTEALTLIEKREIEAGLTASEQFGSLAESIPAGELTKWIPGLSGAERPSGNVQTAVTGLRQLKTRSRDVISAAESGDLTRTQAEERINVIEGEIQEGESRIKLLIQNSPELKFNSDGVNFIEGKILETRIILNDAKVAAIRGQVADTQMTDLRILETLEEYDIPS